jgi:hypothetical protein
MQKFNRVLAHQEKQLRGHVLPEERDAFNKWAADLQVGSRYDPDKAWHFQPDAQAYAETNKPSNTLKDSVSKLMFGFLEYIGIN